MSHMETLQSIYLEDREAWREWLQANHDKMPGIWLIYYKKHTGKPRVAYNDAVEEALCFGWIDSTIRRIDEETYRQKFTPRNPASTWSETNIKRVESLIRSGKMKAPGLKLVRLAKENGRWEEAVAEKPDLPFSKDLLQILHHDPVARKKYEQLTPGRRKTFNGWVMSAKKPETRLKRCLEMIRLLKNDEELGMR